MSSERRGRGKGRKPTEVKATRKKGKKKEEIKSRQERPRKDLKDLDPLKRRLDFRFSR